MGKVAREAVRDLQALVNKFSRFHQSTLSIEQFTSFGEFQRLYNSILSSYFHVCKSRT